jgi:hypothetical protein
MPARIEFTAELKAAIEAEIIAGASVASICGTSVFPHNESSLWRYLHKDQEFASIIARAMETRSDRDIEECRSIAMGATAETWQLAQMQIRTLQWEAGKRRPKKYGDKLAHTGASGDGPIELIVKHIGSDGE